ncbi:MAG: hypothetical protein OEW68_07755 [Gammaproteobacteria bacterium]|nr:hypothetical protein [Gammaproteobacteria bacterium]MDH4314719.1 hypothetical protein [Gammaproteobacteria bacterium]
MSTFQELQHNDHSLGLYCITCDRWGMADLQLLIDTGRGNYTVTGARFRCTDCGSLVQKQLRPPAPTLGNTARYI